MGANRAMRRQQVKDQMREWVRSGNVERMRQLQQNGITERDLKENYDIGWKDGYRRGGERTLKIVYAGILHCMWDAGNSRIEALSFLKAVDEHLVTVVDGDEDFDDVMKRVGIELVLKNGVDRMREV